MNSIGKVLYVMAYKTIMCFVYVFMTPIAIVGFCADVYWRVKG